MLPDFVSVGPFQYEVLLMSAAGWRYPGLCCHADHDTMRLFVNSDVSPDERAEAVRRAAEDLTAEHYPRRRLVVGLVC